MEKIKKLYKEHKEGINYLFFGGCTTVVNFIAYGLTAKLLGIDELVSNVIAWVIAILFAYVTNKLFVFESKTEGTKAVLKEMIAFVIGRLLSGILCSVGTFALMIRVFHINDIFSKLVTQVMEVIVNYLLSKLIIFKEKE